MTGCGRKRPRYSVKPWKITRKVSKNQLHSECFRQIDHTRTLRIFGYTMEDGFFRYNTPFRRGLVNANIHPFGFFWVRSARHDDSKGFKVWDLKAREFLLWFQSFHHNKPLPSCCSVQIYWTHMCSTYFLKLGIVSISWVSKQSKRHNTQSSFFVWWGTNFLFERLRWVRTLCQLVWCIFL